MGFRAGGATGAVAVLLCLGTLFVAEPAGARDVFETDSTGCLIRVPARVHLASPYAAAGDDGSVEFTVRPRGGVVIRHARVELWTWGGELLARSREVRRIGDRTTVSARLEVTELQAGRFTAVIKGEPNRKRSCGPKETARVVRLRPCPKRLPIGFPDRPRGAAADYEAYLSVPIAASRGETIREIESRIYSFDGDFFGEAAVPLLFGQTTAHHPLVRPLEPGGYTVLVEGTVEGVPKGCGDLVAKTVLKFR